MTEQLAFFFHAVLTVSGRRLGFSRGASFSRQASAAASGVTRRESWRPPVDLNSKRLESINHDLDVLVLLNFIAWSPD
jgi:hypothetical protein